jgi:hypothetical protein
MQANQPARHRIRVFTAVHRPACRVGGWRRPTPKPCLPPLTLRLIVLLVMVAFVVVLLEQGYDIPTAVTTVVAVVLNICMAAAEAVSKLTAHPNQPQTGL